MSEEIKLEHPIEVDGRTIESINVRRLKVRDQVAASKKKGTEAEVEVHLFANLCELTPANIEELDMVDYRKIQDIYTGFLE